MFIHLQIESDVVIGRLLLCGAIIHSGKAIEQKDITKCVQIFAESSHLRTQHSSVAYAFLTELFNNSSSDQFEAAVWPVMSKELKRNWEKQNINTLQFLIIARSKYPHLVDDEFLRSTLATNEILSVAAYDYLRNIFWEHPSKTCVSSHPAFDTFAEFLVKNVPRKKLLHFWHTGVDKWLQEPSIIKIAATIRILTKMFTSDDLTPETVIALLSDSVITSIVTVVKLNTIEPYQVLLQDFYASIERYMETMLVHNEPAKVSIIKRFISHPGSVLFEQRAQVHILPRLFQSLQSAGVIELFAFFKEILLERIPRDPKNKNASWSHTERLKIIQLMQILINSPTVNTEFEWRCEQLKFWFKLAFFHVNGEQLVTKEEESGIIKVQEATAIKQIFFVNLLRKVNKSEEEIDFLLKLVNFINDLLSQKSLKRSLRKQFTNELLQGWSKLYARVKEINSGKDSKSELNQVFSVLLLQMGLHLFQDSDTAIDAIDDLEKCLDRAQRSGKSKTNNDGEPEWIEVIVDLLLHLLSLNNNLLRNVVNHVFPRLCSKLSLTAVHQILSMLDMKEESPLALLEATRDTEMDVENGESDNEENDSEGESDEEEDGDEEENEDEDDDDDEEDGESGAESEEDVDDEANITDKLRLAVSQALTSGQTDTDNESIDLNEMDDAEVERLDAALSDAFKTIRGVPRTKVPKRKTKKERSFTSAVCHFRCRVLDLIELYLDKQPSLCIVQEIFLTLISMLDRCATTNKDQDASVQHLWTRLNRVLRKLLAMRQFDDVNDIDQSNLVDVLNALVDCKTALDEKSDIMWRSISFLMNVSELINSESKSNNHRGLLFERLQEFFDNFMRTRNPKLSPNCIENIMKSRNLMVYQLGLILATPKDGERLVRRRQAFDILINLCKNRGFITATKEEFEKFAIALEKQLVNYMKKLQKSGQPIDPKFRTSLFNLLINIRNNANLYTSEVNWSQIGQIVHDLQRTSTKDMRTYNKLCISLNIDAMLMEEVDEIIREARKATTTNLINGVNRKRKNSENEVKSVSTNKNNQQNAKKLKREKKLERMRLASAGLETVSFLPQNHADNSDTDDDEQK